MSVQEVEWGKFNMVEAERRLVANALLDPSNKRFVLISEATVPLFNFPTIYSYLINSTKSFVEVFDLDNAVGRGRYNKRMRPIVTLEQWRKGSQWFEMERHLALQMVSDQIYFPIFSRFCQPPCYGDEHYLPTLVHILSPEKSANRTITWADWSKPGPHPGSYSGKQVNEGLLTRLRTGFDCEYNGAKTNMCYLFARKFKPDALDALMRLAPKVMGY